MAANQKAGRDINQTAGRDIVHNSGVHLHYHDKGSSALTQQEIKGAVQEECKRQEQFRSMHEEGLRKEEELKRKPWYDPRLLGR